MAETTCASQSQKYYVHLTGKKVASLCLTHLEVRQKKKKMEYILELSNSFYCDSTPIV